MKIPYRFLNGLKPAQIMVLGFASLILIGTLLLMLPISSVNNEFTPFIDALFTSTSAVCVTGLVIYDTGTYWSVFGKTIILMLIQIGGLGFMTVSTSIAIILGKKIGLRNRMIMQEALNQFSISGVIRLTQYVVIATLVIESIGAFLMSFRFIPLYGIKNGIYYSVFHSVSAFCNAGFDIVGNFRSLTPFAKDPIINLVVIALVISGGLGFAVIADLSQMKRLRKLSLHTKLVLTVTGVLLALGFLVTFIVEFTNVNTIGNFTLSQKLIASLFQSVTPRTAGFNTLDLNSLRMPTRFLTMILMFIGGSPGSTAGGIKTTTFGIMFLSIIATARGHEDIKFAKRRISKQTINRALAVIIVSTFWIVFMTFSLIMVEPNFSFESIMFEAMSAFGTVGLSLGITPFLSVAGKIIITLMMFFGRLGPLTIVLAISNHGQLKKELIRYPEGRIIVG